MKLIAPLPNYLSTIWGGSRLSKIREFSATRKAFGICREVSTYRNAEIRSRAEKFCGHELASAGQTVSQGFDG